MPKWSPDGTKIAFVGNNPNNDYADIAVITLSFDAERPITSNVIANPNPVSVGIGITLTALVSDETTGGSAISSAEFSIDGGLFSDMNAKDGTFDEVTEEVDETEESEDQEQDVFSYQINSYPADITLKGYLDKWDEGQIEIPEFQRNYVWDQVKASKLIEQLGKKIMGVIVTRVSGVKSEIS